MIMRDLVFLILHSLGVPGILRRSRVKNEEISVLTFHRISDDRDPLWPPMPVETFRILMKQLSERTCVIPLEKIEAVETYPDKPLVSLSFDDGYLDFLENALPVLKSFKLPANHNICPDLIDKGVPPYFHIDKVPKSKIPKTMNWDQVRKCAASGIHIGSHGMNHLNMSRIEDKEMALAEIKDSRDRIRKEIGVEPLIFAFPRGMYNSLSMRLVKDSGYKIALLCEDMVTTLTGSNKGFYIFPRINICRANWKEENLCLLGFHQKVKSRIKRRPYVFVDNNFTYTL